MVRLPFTRQLKDNTGRLDPRICQWVLPAWFYYQAEPESPFFSISNEFKNLTRRNWTVLRPEHSLERYTLGRDGVLTMACGCSLEIWIYDGSVLITPSQYYRVDQQYFSKNSGITTRIHTGAGRILLCYQVNESTLDFKLSFVSQESKGLRPIWILLVVRPFNHDGMAPIYQIEYKEFALWINQKKVISFDKGPSHSFFANETTGDIFRYFVEGRGNTGITSTAGYCTGFVGYSGLPEELTTIRAVLGNPGGKRFCFVREDRWLTVNGNVRLHTLPSGSVQTGTIWDEFGKVARQHMKVFSPHNYNGPVQITQILSLNRLNFLEHSKAYLKSCLKKIRINGDFPSQFLGPAKWIIGAADYYRMSHDQDWLVTNWPDIYKMSWYLNQNEANEHPDFGRFWICAAWRELAELARSNHKIDESRRFTRSYLALLQELYRTVSELAIPEKIRSGGLGSRQLLQLLQAFVPLHLWEEDEFPLERRLKRFEEHYIRDGGVFSPTEFKGIDLELTAKWCQYLLWAGLDYEPTLRFLLRSAGQTWSWPDAVNPLNLNGIGEHGHDPSVLYQMILLWRMIFLHEVGSYLYILPGVFNCGFWSRPHIKIDRVATGFGKISLLCQTIGPVTQITLHADYRQKPSKIRFKLNPLYQVCYADTDIHYRGRILEAEADLQIIRFKKCTNDACLDNTFSANI